MTLIEIATVATFLVSAFALIRTIWDKRFDEIKLDAKDRFSQSEARTQRLEEKIDRHFEKVSDQFSLISYDISEIKERVAAIEMSTVFLQINPNPIARSEAAKKMWEKRKNKQLEKK